MRPRSPDPRKKPTASSVPMRPRSRVVHLVSVTWPQRRATVAPRGSEATCKFANSLVINASIGVASHDTCVAIARMRCRDESLTICSFRGFFGKGDMQTEFEQASFALQPGQVRLMPTDSDACALADVQFRYRKYSAFIVGSFL